MDKLKELLNIIGFADNGETYYGEKTYILHLNETTYKIYISDTITFFGVKDDCYLSYTTTIDIQKCIKHIIGIEDFKSHIRKFKIKLLDLD